MIAPAVARDQTEQSYLHIRPMFNSTGSNTTAVSTGTMVAPAVTRDQTEQSYLHIRPMFNSTGSNTITV